MARGPGYRADLRVGAAGSLHATKVRLATATPPLLTTPYHPSACAISGRTDLRGGAGGGLDAHQHGPQLWPREMVRATFGEAFGESFQRLLSQRFFQRKFLWRSLTPTQGLQHPHSTSPTSPTSPISSISSTLLSPTLPHRQDVGDGEVLTVSSPTLPHHPSPGCRVTARC